MKRAEELAQETFLAVIRATARYEPRWLVRTYLYGIALKLLAADRGKHSNTFRRAGSRGTNQQRSRAHRADGRGKEEPRKPGGVRNSYFEDEGRLQGPGTDGAVSTSSRIRNAAVEGYETMVGGLIGIALFLASWGPSLLLWSIILFFPARGLWRRLRRVRVAA